MTTAKTEAVYRENVCIGRVSCDEMGQWSGSVRFPWERTGNWSTHLIETREAARAWCAEIYDLMHRAHEVYWPTRAGQVVHVNDAVAGAVYVGRRFNRRRLNTSPFANPYPIGSDRSVAGRSVSVELFRDMLSTSTGLLWALPVLRGRPLACWCRHVDEERRPDNACHADVLLELLDQYTDDELRAFGGQR